MLCSFKRFKEEFGNKNAKETKFFDHLSESKNFFSNQIRAKNQSQFQQKGVPVDFEEVIFIIHALIKPDGISSLRNFDFITAIVLDLSSFCTHFISFWIIFTAACHVMWKSTTSFLGKRGQIFSDIQSKDLIKSTS